MQLEQLVKAISPVPETNGEIKGVEVKGLAYDSRKVEEGFVFVAIPGYTVDGHDYIPQALQAGACAVICQRPVDTGDKPAIIVADCRRALAAVSAEFYGHPDRRARLIGVTGTNGKTTTTNLIKWLLESAGYKAGLAGTIRNLAGDKELPATHTTPESLELFQLFAMMEEEGCDHFIIEVSSHALAQGRVSACNFAGAVFTNLTQDHLDYHKTMDNYCRCKAQLFAMLDKNAENRYGVINNDDEYAAVFAEHCEAPLWQYGSKPSEKGLQLLDYAFNVSGTSFTCSYEGKTYQVRVPLIGKFNIYNSMAAMTAALAEGISMEQIIKAMAAAPQVDGRFEMIDEGQDFSVVVDYAHTPDGLENLLRAAKELRPRRIIAVFACGGDRDRGKRPIMGRIGAELSDIPIISSDNPRFEDPMSIIKEVEVGVREIRDDFLVEPEREKAISLAISLAEPGDMVVLAGKGHEDYQVIGDVKYPMDERALARKYIREHMAK